MMPHAVHTLRFLTMCLLSCLLLAGCSTLRREEARSEAGLPGPLSASLAQAGIPESAAALDVRSVEGEPLLAHNASVAFKPASVMKLVTTAAALELLGPGHRWTTRVYTEGAVSDGVLQGDIYIQGGGDPRFAHEDLSRLLRRLRALGIGEIRGDLVLDRSLFLLPVEDPAAFDAAPLRAYNAAPDALLLDARALTIRLVPDISAGRAQISAEPPMRDFVIEAPLLNDQPCNSWREQLRPVMSDRALRFEGSFPSSCGERQLALHAYLLDPSRYFNAVFQQLWTELGGTITGSVREAKVPDTARELLRWESLTLAEIIRDINKHSNNVMARQLLLNIAAERGSVPATTAAATTQVLDWLARSGVDARSMVIENGSGLSRSERISAEALSAVLQKEWRSPLMPEFIASLPLAGIDGTMSKRVKDTAVRGQAHIKTGTLVDVASMAGYLTAKSGRRLIVTCMVNHANASQARGGFDQLLAWLYERY